MNIAGLLSKQFLTDIGVSLDEATYKSLAQHYEETLQNRVIEEIVIELDDSQLEDLTRLRDSDVALLQRWLMVNVPQLDEIIEDEIAILLGELAQDSKNF